MRFVPRTWPAIRAGYSFEAILLDSTTEWCFMAAALGRILLLALLLPLVPAVARAQAGVNTVPITVIVTRHAERADDGSTRDPELSEAGRARALALVEALGGAGVSAIYTTQFQRTRATAAPLAAKLGIGPAVIESGGATADHIAALRAAVLSHPAGSVVLVVGHSNTVPMLVRELTGLEVPDMPEAEFGTLYIVTVGSGMPARFIRARY
jgi:broad specificity phosphatase PhoE